MTRDEKGRFLKGTSGNPGGRVAMPADAARMLRDALKTKFTEVEADAIITRLIGDAKRGDPKAREHLFTMIGIDLRTVSINGTGALEILVRYEHHNPDPT